MKTKLEEQENHIKNLDDVTCDTRTTIEKLKVKINTKNQEIENAELKIKSYVEVIFNQTSSFLNDFIQIPLKLSGKFLFKENH